MEQDNQSPELTISDLKNLKNILEATIRRGVYEPAEIAGVGTVYNRLVKFLSAIEAQNAENETQG